MPRYKVMICEVRSGYATIEDESMGRALKKATDIMNEDGVDGFSDFNPTHREAEVLDIEKI